jgi:hypothetical protein
LRKTLTRRLIWKVPLIIALVSFAVWWQLKHNTVPSPDNESPTANSHLSSMLAGSWTAEVSYGSGERQREQFFFQPEGAKLYGTASFLGDKRGIEDGKIAGSAISFYVWFEEILNGATKARVNRYEGKLVGNEIHLKLYGDAGNPPSEFSLVKSKDVSGDSAAGKP